MRPPYKPGDHATALRLVPGIGTCALPVVIVAVDEGWDGEGCVTYRFVGDQPADTYRLHGPAIRDYMSEASR